MAVCCPGFNDAATSFRLGLWQLLSGRRSHLVQRRDCPGVSAGISACYTIPASSRHVLARPPPPRLSAVFETTTNNRRRQTPASKTILAHQTSWWSPAGARAFPALLFPGAKLPSLLRIFVSWMLILEDVGLFLMTVLPFSVYVISKTEL